MLCDLFISWCTCMNTKSVNDADFGLDEVYVVVFCSFKCLGFTTVFCNTTTVLVVVVMANANSDGYIS